MSRPDSGYQSALSSAYIFIPMPTCRRLELHEIVQARCFALLNAGNNMAARIAMMAITTSNSMSVNARRSRMPPFKGRGRPTERQSSPGTSIAALENCHRFRRQVHVTVLHGDAGFRRQQQPAGVAGHRDVL